MLKNILLVFILLGLCLPTAAFADTTVTGQAAGGVSVSEAARPVGNVSGNLASHGKYHEGDITLSANSYLTRPSFYLGGDFGLLPESVWQFGVKGQLRSGYFFGYDDQVVMDWRVAPELVWKPGSALSVRGKVDVSPLGPAPRLNARWYFIDQTAIDLATWYEVHHQRFSVQGGLIGRLTNTVILDLRPGFTIGSGGEIDWLGSFQVTRKMEPSKEELAKKVLDPGLPTATDRHWQYRAGLNRWVDPWDDQLRSNVSASAVTPLALERFALTGWGKIQLEPSNWYETKLELSYRLPSRWQIIMVGERTWRPNPDMPTSMQVLVGLTYRPPDK